MNTSEGRSKHYKKLITHIMTSNKEITGTQAAHSFEALTQIKRALATGRISYDNAKYFAEPHLSIINEHAKNISRKYKRPAGKITFTAFMR